MPIEIRELVIRTEIGGSSSKQPTVSNQPGLNTDKLVQDAVDKVLEVIEKKKER